MPKHQRDCQTTGPCPSIAALTRHAEELLASALVTAIHFKHSKGKPLTLTVKGTTSPQDCPLQIMKAYLSVRGVTAGPLFLYCPSVPVTCAKFSEQL